MNSFLYWCKKKMTLQDIDAFTKGGESAVLTKFATLEKVAPKTDEAQTWFERAEKSATANPEEHLLIAIRFFEVADRFQGSGASLKAQDRSLKELLQDKSAVNKPTQPPVAVSAPKPAPVSSGSQPIPPAAKLKEAEKTIKDRSKPSTLKQIPPVVSHWWRNCCNKPTKTKTTRQRSMFSYTNRATSPSPPAIPLRRSPHRSVSARCSISILRQFKMISNHWMRPRRLNPLPPR